MLLENVKQMIPSGLKDEIRFCTRVFDGVRGKKNKGYNYWINKELTDGNYLFCGIPNRHCFIGYYDFEQIKNQSLIALSVKKNANPKKDNAEIVCFDLSEPNRYRIIGDTKTWCWQQGSRIKWFANNTEYIFCNDLHDSRYVSKIINVNKGVCEQIINEPLYDISSDDTFGIALNFARSERLRPGYGYSILNDDTEGEYYPQNDGLWYVDIASGKKSLLVSLYELSACDENKNKNEHYLNHISISPDDKNVFFLYIRKEADSEKRITEGYIYNFKKNKFYSLGITGMSHYDWIDNRKIVYAAGLGNGKVGYFTVDIITLEKKPIGEKILQEDGHPTYFSNGIILDTYPHKDQFQELFYYNVEHNDRILIGDFFHKPVYSHDKRCDLHPRISHTKNGIYLSCDTTCAGDTRSVFVCKLSNKFFHMREGKNGWNARC